MPSQLRSIIRRPLALAGLAIAAFLSACAGYGPQALKPGTSIDETMQSMGTPTGRYAMNGGSVRLEFARGPAGLHTFMLDFDAQGRLVKSEQVLTEGSFTRIQAGMTRDEVLRTIGRPSNVGFIHWQKRQLWNYRYDSVFCQWFQVSLDTENRVVEAGYGPDPRCEVERDLFF